MTNWSLTDWLFHRRGRQAGQQSSRKEATFRAELLRDIAEAFTFLSKKDALEILWVRFYPSFGNFEAILDYRTLRVQIVWDRYDATVYVAPPVAAPSDWGRGPWVALPSILSNILQDELGPRSAMIYDGPNARRRHLEDWSRLIQQYWPAIVDAVNDR